VKKAVKTKGRTHRGEVGKKIQNAIGSAESDFDKRFPLERKGSRKKRLEEKKGGTLLGECRGAETQA